MCNNSNIRVLIGYTAMGYIIPVQLLKLFSAVCVVQGLEGGYRSPAVGYTVTPQTTITSFCDSGYNLETNQTSLSKCGDVNQPNCYS